MKKIFLVIIFIFSITTLSAQVNRSIGAGQYENKKKNKNKQIDLVEILKDKLNLDGFQEAIVRNLINDNQAITKEIIESTAYSDIEKRDKISKIGDEFNAEIKKSLSPEQIEKYDKLISKK
ncbi:hypothetical protein ACFSX9_05040 [Flavobacterium ardleyense]|uniref:Uncharacterized protein n=1 Tax=Flavobacterium ardleyense TaxID=2038737 RepID=A0ABW5Z6E8_9FLAO